MAEETTYRDLFDYLYTTYTGDTTPDVTVADFIEHCRDKLKGNPIITMHYDDHGIGVNLQDGERLPFVDYGEDTTEQPTVVSITTPAAGRRGVQMMPLDNSSVRVTDPEKVD